MWNDTAVALDQGFVVRGVAREAVGRAVVAHLTQPASDSRPLDAIAASESSASELLASVREAIETLSYDDEYPTVRATAALLGTSVRTLQRRLAQAGTSHQELVGHARFATAAVVLERPDAKILELALDLGYSDHANFTRAFRRWAGCAPREFRSTRARSCELLSARRLAKESNTAANRRATQEEAR